jgi:hypothetical protein
VSRAGLIALVIAGAAARAEARGCSERSEILGKQHCSRFGDGWDVSRGHPWVVGFGLQVARFPVGDARFSAQIVEKGGDANPFSVSGSDLGGAWTSGSPTLRIAMFPARIFYVGVEGSYGGGALPDAHFIPAEAAPGKLGVVVPASNALAMHSTYFSAGSIGAILGLSVPVSRLDLGVELLIGMRAASANFEFDNPDAASAATGGCWTGAKGGTVCPWVDVNHAFSLRLEPRASLAVRLTPWLTERTLVGFDALQGGTGFSVSALLEVHTRAYDGFYKRRSTVE